MLNWTHEGRASKNKAATRKVVHELMNIAATERHMHADTQSVRKDAVP